MTTWKKINSKIIHKNPWYSFREDDVIRPDGNPGKYFYLDDLSSVAIIAEDDNGDVYLVGQTRYPIGNIYSWEIIGGGIESEGALEAAKRELEEEAGLLAKEWIELGHYYVSNAYSSDKAFVFLAKDLKIVESKSDATEDITIKKVCIKELKRMIIDGELTDGFSLAAINKYFLYKKL